MFSSGSKHNPLAVEASGEERVCLVRGVGFHAPGNGVLTGVGNEGAWEV